MPNFCRLECNIPCGVLKQEKEKIMVYIIFAVLTQTVHVLHQEQSQLNMPLLPQKLPILFPVEPLQRLELHYFWRAPTGRLPDVPREGRSNRRRGDHRHRNRHRR